MEIYLDRISHMYAVGEVLSRGVGVVQGGRGREEV